MKPRVFIAHGWADDPTQGWIAWLVKQLQANDIEVVAPAFPNPEKPSVEIWTNQLAGLICEADEQTVLVGHSLGVFLILRYLSEPGAQVAGAVLVAGGLPTHRPELLKELNFESVIKRAAKRICIYSDDDRVVPPERSLELAKAINAETVLDSGKRHFSGLRGCNELPSALNAVLSCLISTP
ncbi:MAG TPA: alpha/beta fold hydrolase [Candidatus Nanoarchaeia archaeon]|nr:alpha/beta fold hydrolase [Candidatus Nanoarchaeia archaeon]